MNEENINKGVVCNVCDCVYNEKGCNCNRSVIEVSQSGKDFMPEDKTPHFCKSYICKSDCECKH